MSSRIFQAESGIEARSLRFAELDEAGGQEEDSFLVFADGQARGREKETKDGGPGVFQSNTSESAKQPPADIEAIRQEAYKAGKADGRAEVEQELHSAAAALGDALEQISRLRRSLMEKSSQDMVRLAVAVARRVIDEEADEKRDMIVKTVNRALESAVEDEEYYIKVNPSDLETVKAHEPMFLASMKGLRNIYFLADENISRGGCIAESRAGDVDATIESQLHEISEHLQEAIN